MKRLSMKSAMSGLTAGLYGLLLVYGLGWYLGKWTGNFSLLLFILSAVTLLYWLAERFYFAKQRAREVALAEQEIEQRRARLAAQGITHLDTLKPEEREQRLAQPWWLDWTAGLFPVILAVFLLRSFVFEPFKIPSGSMIPTLVVGDLILVNKFHYGIRLPVLHKKILANNDPKRGDVMVFRFPANPSQDYIKRVVGIPGDTVSYRNQTLSVNGVELPREKLDPYYDEDAQAYSTRFEEDLTGLKHQVLVDPSRLNLYRAPTPPFPGAENCVYSLDGVSCKVPAGHYFMLGDNRDSSLDSRYWGFVPDENIVGKAFFVWMNFGNLKRIGGFQ
jgi:signal peptidase I